ncbi:MAG: SIS domain-containing protein [Planctomycetes bacterium]|nr:SIS domain-containing protein [Planctomycetota bacterium]
MSETTCEQCGKRPATVHVTDLAEGAPTEHLLCGECAGTTRTADVVGLRVVAPEPAALDLVAQVREAILGAANAKLRLAELAAGDIAQAAAIVAECLRGGRKVLLCGNGGSAAEAQHIAAELVGRFRLERPALPAIALTTNTSILTAIGNDYGFDDVFARQVGALGAPGDVLFAYSTSGTSKNVLRAIQAAKTAGMKTVGFTGQGGGSMAHQCDVCIQAPSNDTPTVQECHTAAGHTICRLVEEMLFS